MYSSEEFLKISSEFKLGLLTTERPNKLTENMAELAISDLNSIISILLDIDISIFDILANNIDNMIKLNNDIRNTIENKGRIFLSGCGATGRLSLTLENIWRIQNSKNENLKNVVISLMAGGDIALIKSVEDFEDHDEFGEQQLKELGFNCSDLLISSTEGGETSWVIGTTNYASKIKAKVYFLYCNPDDELQNLKRSKQILDNDSVNKINLTCGSMALSGSTRMQASTIILSFIGFSMKIDELNLSKYIKSSCDLIKKILKESTTLDFIKNIVINESSLYLENEYNKIYYLVDKNFGMTILTDTTERSPTFTLAPFENKLDLKSELSKCYMLFLNDEINEDEIDTNFKNVADLKNYFSKLNNNKEYNDNYDILKNNEDDWKCFFINRLPRTLDSNYWNNYKNRVNYNRFLNHIINLRYFDERENINEKSSKNSLTSTDFMMCYKCNKVIKIAYLTSKHLKNDNNSNENLNVLDTKITLDLFDDILLENIVLKCILNIHSTLVMGRLKRYKSNIMTYVKPSNLKLIDRAIRYVEFLLKQNNISHYSYDDICHQLFENIKTYNSNSDSIVLMTFNSLYSSIFNN